MRFVWSVAAFVLAALMIGAGIAQRTVFQGPTTEVSEISVQQDAPYLLIDGGVLTSLPGSQTLRARDDGTIFAAYGRTADLKAWLATSDYNAVTLTKEGKIASKHVEATAAAPAEDAGSGDGPAPEPAGPAGSDLWLDEFSQDDLLIAPLQLPSDMSLLVATDGTAPAPSDVSISWPVTNATPWAGPLIVGGGVLLAIGVFLYLLGIRHARRSRGPRRKGLPLPVTEPIDLATEQADKGVISATPPTRRALAKGRRSFAVIPVIAISALALSGCTADAWPQFDSTPTPSPTETVVVPEGQQPPAVTKAQAERILTRISDTVAKADADRDEALAATRLDGAALAVRATNYTLRGALPDQAALPAIVDKPLEILLPQAFDGWPRSVLAVVDDAANKVSNIMLMTQQDPWSNYKISFISSLEGSTTMPDLAPAYIGSKLVPPDTGFLILAPDQLAAAYSDILNNGDDSQFAGLFDAGSDKFRVNIAADRQKRLDAFNQTATNTGTLTFSSTPGTHTPVSIATLESGAIVAVDLNETDTVKPTNADAVIKLDDNPTVKTLAGVTESSTGFTTTFADQLFFYVPGQGSNERIRLLAVSSSILNAQVIQ